jgi:hypothetical protein
MPKGDNVLRVANAINNQLPGAVLQIPIGLTAQRSVQIRFALNDNITNVVEAFVNYFTIDPQTKVEILKRARFGMAPGTFMV